jgi:hypothetical protein
MADCGDSFFQMLAFFLQIAKENAGILMSYVDP